MLTYDELVTQNTLLHSQLTSAETRLSETATRLVETEARLAEANAHLFKMQELLKLALERVAKLEERLNKNSNNSSKPPSSDQKSNLPDKPKKDRQGRAGHHRVLLPREKIDHFHICKLVACPFCSSHDLVDQNKPLILQQVELPEVKAFVTQFECHKYACSSCGNAAFAPLPEGVPDSVFGPRLMALIATLTGTFHLAKREAMLLVGYLYGVDMSEGSVINVEERVAAALEEVYVRIHKHVMTSVMPKHFDETSWRNSAKIHWAWVASTANATCFRIDPHRSKEAFKRFTGVLGQAPVVTDRYGAYNDLERPHQYCLAHLIRDFRKYAERDGPDGEIGKLLEEDLLKICKTQRLFREGKISVRSRNISFGHQKRRLSDHLIDGLANGAAELSELCDKLWDSMDKLWTFSNYTDVDPTNNLAERDLRKLVIWRKKSYGTKSSRGENFVEKISSIASTLKKAKKNVLDFIAETVKAFYLNSTSPFISAAHYF